MNKIIYAVPLALSILISGCTNTGVHVTSVELNETNITLVVGDTFSLVATVKPDDAAMKFVKWMSYDTSVAYVNSDGLVKAFGEGTTTIKATCVDNNNIYATCEVTVEPAPEDDDNDDAVIFTCSPMKAYMYSSTKTVDVNTYYRSDKLRQLPYVSLKDYYRLLLNKELDIKTISAGQYSITSGNGGKAIIDTENDILDSDDYESFITTTIYRQEGVGNVYFDGAPFIRVNHSEADVEAKHKTINFRKYGINLFGKTDDIYLPLATASNIFQGPTMITCFYNKDNIYFIDPNDPDFDTDTVINDDEYQEGILKFFSNGYRSADEAEFSYGELCFLIDTYYGLSGRETLHNSLMTYKSLNDALLNHDKYTQAARDYLLSTKLEEYFAGLTILQAYLSDAGHTYVNYGSLLLGYSYSDIYYGVKNIISNIGFDENKYTAKQNTTTEYRMGLSNARREAPTKNNDYTLSGDTLLYRFDAFDFDIHDWNHYYEDPTNNTLPQDPVGNFKRMLDQYKDNSSVKNVVVDISTNGGGYGDVVAAFMGLMTGQVYECIHDMINDQYVTTYYDFDANFDGVFDENDQNVQYHYNYAILCSSRSFSCGNMLPLQAKECGVMILGDQSGGGSCAVIDACSAEGLYTRLSCQNHLVYLDKTEAEFGVPADYKTVIYLGDDKYDFTNFYNVELMSQEMAKFYA